MTREDKFKNLISKLNDISYKLVGGNAKAWANVAREKGLIKPSDEAEIIRLVNLRNTMSHGGAGNVVISEEELNIVRHYIKIIDANANKFKGSSNQSNNKSNASNFAQKPKKNLVVQQPKKQNKQSEVVGLQNKLQAEKQEKAALEKKNKKKDKANAALQKKLQDKEKENAALQAELNNQKQKQTQPQNKSTFSVGNKLLGTFSGEIVQKDGWQVGNIFQGNKLSFEYGLKLSYDGSYNVEGIKVRISEFEAVDTKSNRGVDFLDIDFLRSLSIYFRFPEMKGKLGENKFKIEVPQEMLSRLSSMFMTDAKGFFMGRNGERIYTKLSLIINLNISKGSLFNKTTKLLTGELTYVFK